MFQGPQRLAIALVAAGLGTGVAVPATAALAGASSPAPARAVAHQRFVMTEVSLANKDRPTRVVAAGPIHGQGTLHERVVRQTPTGSILAATIKLAEGSVTLRVHDADSMKLDLRTCTARESGAGTWRIVSGTGAYRDATGSGTFERRSFIVGSFDSAARCLGQPAPPTAVTSSVVVDGTASS